MSRATKIFFHPLVLLVLAAFLLRVADLGRSSFWYDELLQTQIARNSVSDILAQVIHQSAMPLDYLITHALLAFNSSEAFLRLPAVLFSTLGVLAIYFVGKAFFNRTLGFLSAVLLAASAFSIFYAREARPYSLLLLASLASYYFFFRALKSNRLRDWFFYALASTVSALTHYFALTFIAAQILFLLVGAVTRLFAPARATLFGQLNRKTALGACLAFALVLGALALMPYFQTLTDLLVLSVQTLLAPNSAPPDFFADVVRGDGPPQVTFEYLYWRVLENLSGGGYVMNATFVAFAFVGIGAQLKTKSWTTLLLVIWAIVPTALVFAILILRGAFFGTRYVIFTLPPWLILIACGIQTAGTFIARAFPRARLRRFAFAFCALAFVTLSLDRSSLVLATLKEDWRDAGAFLQANLRAGDALIVPGGGNVIFEYAPHASEYQVNADVVEQLQAIAAQAPRTFVVVSPYYFDPGKTFPAWLDAAGAIEFRVDDSIQIYYYRRDADHASLLNDAKSFALPPTPSAFATLGDQFAYANDLATARADYARALALAQTNHLRAELDVGLGDLERRANDFTAAQSAYHGALVLDAGAINAYVGLARIDLAANKLDDARANLDRAYALDSDSYATLYFFADYYSRTGATDAANQMYARAARINPELVAPP